MRVVSMDAPFTVAVAEVPDPVPGLGEVSIRVRKIGMCGTDLRTYTGQNPNVEYPRIFGHELGGQLDAAARIAGTEYSAGTVVTVLPYTHCGKCAACRRRREYACRHNKTLGNQRDGAASERLVIPSEKVYPLPDLTLDEAVCVEPISVGFHAARRGEIAAEDTVVVLGTGMIGLGAVLGAATRSAKVIAVDLDDHKLDIASKCGAAHTVNNKSESVDEAVAQITGGEGADVVIEAIGLPATYRQAIDLVAFAGRVVYIGYAKEDVPLPTKYFVGKELDIRGSRNAAPEDFYAGTEPPRMASMTA